MRGTSLLLVSPGAGKCKDTRSIDISEGDKLDEAQMATFSAASGRALDSAEPNCCNGEFQHVQS